MIPALEFREQALDEAQSALEAGAPFVAFAGPLGSGTTTLLRALLRRRGPALGPATLVSCAGARSAGEVLERAADALGLPVERGLPGARLRALLGARLDDGPRLLAFDDLPSFDDLADAVADWLAVAPELRVVASATAPPAGAFVVAVGPLPRDQAAQFLASAVRRRSPGAALSPEQIEGALHLSGGLFLALEVVAARLASFGPLALQEGSWPALEATLRRVVDALPPAAALAARSLAAFAGPFTAEAARAVLDGDDQALATLCLASLVEPCEGPSQRLLPPLQRVLAPPPEAVERHAAYFEKIEAPGVDQLADLTRAFDALERAGQRARAAALALRLDGLYVRARPLAEHLELLRRAEALTDDPDQRTSLALGRGRALAIHGQARDAVVVLEKALTAWPASASPRTLLLCVLCYALRASGDLERAAAVGRQAVERAEQARDPGLLAAALQLSSLVDLDSGRFDEAQRLCALAEAHAYRPQDARLAAICAANRTLALLALGNTAEARPCLQRTIEGFDRAGDLLLRRRVACMEATLLRLERDLDGAQRRIEEARGSLVAVGDDRGELEATLEATLIARARDDGARAEALLAQARWLSERVDDASLRRRVDDLAAAPPPGPHPPRRALRLVHQGDSVRRVELDGRLLEAGRRGPLLRILLGLARARGKAFSAAELQALGWPGERMSAESGAARVYMTIRRLRAFGLGELVVTDAEGYRLHGSLEVSVEADPDSLGTVRFPTRAPRSPS